MDPIVKLFRTIDEYLQKPLSPASVLPAPRASIASILNKLSIETIHDSEEVKQKRNGLIAKLKDSLVNPPNNTRKLSVLNLKKETDSPCMTIIKRSPLFLFQDTTNKCSIDVLTPLIPKFSFLLEKMLFDKDMFRESFIEAITNIDWNQFCLVQYKNNELKRIGLTSFVDFDVMRKAKQRDLDETQIEDLHSETNKTKEKFKKYILFMRLFLKHKYIVPKDLDLIINQYINEYNQLLEHKDTLYIIKNEIQLYEYKILMLYKTFKYPKKTKTITEPIIAKILDTSSFYRFKLTNET
ncbi:hypothetical protein DLEV_050 [Diachasmimorpha longicaudata entomopoxvirus]|uniref:Uncharacterized protein n=1 Tax=Diachasmimorpha longicaudata entomopoxvirus TaxID=109981 RepID=A0A7R5WJZ1_9POXV|nr:hypothetical protein QKK69_gp050 [Diachasmimorpha longicaudata entomopoxvirus]AKS26341.1 hypothetical protein DLEV_050 [Diachasmimorpha longicaudata entomopoxvirus]